MNILQTNADLKKNPQLLKKDLYINTNN